MRYKSLHCPVSEPGNYILQVKTMIRVIHQPNVTEIP